MPTKEERPRDTDRPGKKPGTHEEKNPGTGDEQIDESRHGQRRPNQAPDEDVTREKNPNREQQAPRKGEEQGGGRRDR